MARVSGLLAALFGAVFLVAYTRAACPAPAVEISANIIMYTDIDYKYGCHTMLKTMKSRGLTRVNFIPTHFFVDNDNNNIPDYFKFRFGNGVSYVADLDSINTFSLGMQSCMQKAIDLGFDWIEITPHLDDANQIKWRNLLQLNPFIGYGGGYSYLQIMLDPISTALANLKGVGPNVQVHFSLQGEMNAAIIFYPAEWLKLVSYLKQRVPLPKLYIGINNNFNQICSICTGPNWAPASKTQFDLPTLAKLYNAVDFIALSAYAPIEGSWQTIKPANMERSIDVFAAELVNFDISLTSLVTAGKRIHYSEFGLGGGACDEQTCVAPDPAAVAAKPYFGIGGVFKPNLNPWANTANRDFLRSFYTVATQFAAKGTGGKWVVDSIFIWTYGSYDVIGVNPISTIRRGSYMDPTVVSIINNYNSKCSTASA